MDVLNNPSGGLLLLNEEPLVVENKEKENGEPRSRSRNNNASMVQSEPS